MLATNAVERLRPTQKLDENTFARDVIEGLSQPQKTLPCRYFYDARGSDLFEDITRLPEYYPTRAETEILTTHCLIPDFPKNGVLVEFGSGSSLKTELLLADMPVGATYVAIDVSIDALREAGSRLVKRFPHLDVRLVVGDFSRLAQLPIDLSIRPKIGFFPGSTIGNLTLTEASNLLERFKRLLSPSGRLVVGVDLKKDVAVLERAYDDAAGVTAAFNLNLLHRVNREIEPAFDVSAFRHAVVYNARQSRIEMHLVSTRDQIVALGGHLFAFRCGETIHTENSHKYTVRTFHALARRAGWSPLRTWTDSAGLFSVHDLR
jgi:dimethylhistidine N-methyltransferase